MKIWGNLHKVNSAMRWSQWWRHWQISMPSIGILRMFLSSTFHLTEHNLSGKMRCVLTNSRWLCIVPPWQSLGMVWCACSIMHNLKLCYQAPDTHHLFKTHAPYSLDLYVLCMDYKSSNLCIANRWNFGISIYVNATMSLYSNIIMHKYFYKFIYYNISYNRISHQLCLPGRLLRFSWFLFC